MPFEHPKDPPPDHRSARRIHKRFLPPEYIICTYIYGSRGIAHTSQGAFPPYLQPEMTFIDGICPMETTNTGARTASAAISSRSSSPQGGRGLSEIQRRNLLVTPPRGPINRFALEQTEKETEEYESGHDNPANSAEKGSVLLVRFSDESGVRTTTFTLMTIWIKKLLKV